MLQRVCTVYPRLVSETTVADRVPYKCMRIGFCAQSLRETGKRTTPTTRDSCCVSESVRSNDRIVPYSKASPPVQSATPPQKQEQRTPEIRIGIPGHVHNVRSQPRYVIHKYRSTPRLGNKFGPFAASTRWAQVWKLFSVLCPHLRGCQCSYSKTIDSVMDAGRQPHGSLLPGYLPSRLGISQGFLLIWRV